MTKIQIHQLGYAPVIADFHGHEDLAIICMRFLNAELLRHDKVLVSKGALINRHFYYLTGMEKKKKKMVVDLAGDRIESDTEFIQRIYEIDRKKHVDFTFKNKYYR